MVSGTVLVKNAVWARRIRRVEQTLRLRQPPYRRCRGRAARWRTSRALTLRRPRSSRRRRSHVENDQARIVAERRPEPAGHLRPAGGLRPGRNRARRGAVRGAPLPGHARQPRLHQPDAHPAVLRHRSRDARPRPRPDLPGHDARGRDDRRASSPSSTSDPPLPALDILTLLFSDTAPSGDVELARAAAPQRARSSGCCEARATRALTGPLSAEVGRVVEQTFGVDSVPDHARC